MCGRHLLRRRRWSHFKDFSHILWHEKADNIDCIFLRNSLQETLSPPAPALLYMALVVDISARSPLQVLRDLRNIAQRNCFFVDSTRIALVRRIVKQACHTMVSRNQRPSLSHKGQRTRPGHHNTRKVVRSDSGNMAKVERNLNWLRSQVCAVCPECAVCGAECVLALRIVRSSCLPICGRPHGLLSQFSSECQGTGCHCCDSAWCYVVSLLWLTGYASMQQAMEQARCSYEAGKKADGQLQATQALEKARQLQRDVQHKFNELVTAARSLEVCLQRTHGAPHAQHERKVPRRDPSHSKFTDCWSAQRLCHLMLLGTPPEDFPSAL